MLNPAFKYSPSAEKLSKMSMRALRRVKNLVIEHPRFGRIEYDCPIDLVLTNHIREIHFGPGVVDVYPGFEEKPERFKLNQPARFHVYETSNLKDYQSEFQFEQECLKNCADQGIEFLGVSRLPNGVYVASMFCEQWG